MTSRVQHGKLGPRLCPIPAFHLPADSTWPTAEDQRLQPQPSHNPNLLSRLPWTSDVLSSAMTTQRWSLLPPRHHVVGDPQAREQQVLVGLSVWPSPLYPADAVSPKPYRLRRLLWTPLARISPPPPQKGDGGLLFTPYSVRPPVSDGHRCGCPGRGKVSKQRQVSLTWKRTILAHPQGHPRCGWRPALFVQLGKPRQACSPLLSLTLKLVEGQTTYPRWSRKSG